MYYKVPYSFIKSSGEEYQVVKRGRKYHGYREEYNVEKKGKGNQYHLSYDIEAVLNWGRERKFWGIKSRF